MCWDIISRVRHELSVQSRVPISTMHNCIDENNLHDIMDEVISISANLGLALRLQPGDLDRVHEENQ